MKDKKETTEQIKEEDLKETTKKGHSKSEKLQAEIDALKAEIAEKDDKYLRMAAEYDNFRRRSREEKEGIWEAAMADTVTELLPIIDNLERAAQFEAGEKLREGLVMTAKATKSVLYLWEARAKRQLMPICLNGIKLFWLITVRCSAPVTKIESAYPPFIVLLKNTYWLQAWMQVNFLLTNCGIQLQH